jgi:hypothetical protein
MKKEKKSYRKDKSSEKKSEIEREKKRESIRVKKVAGSSIYYRVYRSFYHITKTSTQTKRR